MVFVIFLLSVTAFYTFSNIQQKRENKTDSTITVDSTKATKHKKVSIDSLSTRSNTAMSDSIFTIEIRIII